MLRFKCKCDSRGQSDVPLHGFQQLSSAPSVEVQWRERIAPSGGQHQEILAKREPSSFQGVQL